MLPFGWPRLEAEHEVATTYLLMTESVFYNLASSEGVAAIPRCARSGTPSGSTPFTRRWSSTTASTRGPWHNPKPEYMSEVISEASTSTPSRTSTPVVPVGLEPALALGLSPRGAARRRLSLAADPRAPGDLGLRGRDHGPDDANDAERGEGATSRAAPVDRLHRSRLAAVMPRRPCPVTPRECRGRTSRRSGGAASTPSSSSSTAANSLRGRPVARAPGRLPAQGRHAVSRRWRQLQRPKIFHFARHDAFD